MSSHNKKNENNLTTEQVTTWQGFLFEGRSLRIPVTELGKWPLHKYLWAAVFQAVSIAKERDEDEANWQTPAWDFGRFAKAHPALLNLGEDDALRAIKKSIGTKFWSEHLEMDDADAEMAFVDIWVNCRAVPGYDPLTVAILEARKATAGLIPPDGPAGYQIFIEIARSLHHQRPDESFMLPCHKLAPLLECKPMTISRYRQKAIREGRIKVVKDHTFRSAAKGEATEFVFLK